MSIHLSASRREFLKTTIGTGVVILTANRLAGDISASDEKKIDPNSWIFFSDTHISGDKTEVVRGANMRDNLSRAIDEVLALESRPAGLFVNGDCAYLKGLQEDYAVFAEEIRRLTEAGIDVHMTMGNHDDRVPFLKSFDGKTEQSPVEGKLVSIVKGEKINWFLVDSLQVVNQVTGEIGEAQRAWLSKALDQHSEKPAIVIGHHNPQYLPEGSKDRVTGLADTAELVDVFHAHRQVKGYVYGHTHNWSRKQTAGNVHLINLPPVAYLFDEKRPNGWIHARANEDNLSLTLHALDANHNESGIEHVLAYR